MIKQYKSLKGTILFEYNLIHRINQKNIVLSIKNNLINISCPIDATSKVINTFINNNLFKIQELIKKYNEKKLLSLDNKNPYIYILDKKFNIIFTEGNTHTKIFNDNLFIKKKGSYKDQIKLIYSFLKKEYSYLFLELLIRLIEKTNETVNEIKIYNMNSKWGICYKNLKRIVLNLKLIHFNIETIEYVILHELMHLEFPRHDILFKTKLKNFLPNYLEYENILKNYYI